MKQNTFLTCKSIFRRVDTMKRVVLALVAVALGTGFVVTTSPTTFAQDDVQNSQESQIGRGVVLVAPLGSSQAMLIDKDRRVVHRWDCGSGPANVTYLLEDGSLLRTARVQNPLFQARGGAGGKITRFNWDGELTWEYTVSDENLHHHHDVEPMPNGNVLVIAWERHSREEAIEAGRDPNTLSEGALWSETILELKPVGKNGAEVVWQWRQWDHLVQQFDKTKENYGDVAETPQLIDINYGIRRGGADWIHMNSVDYNAELDQIVMSARWFDEAWVIDHSTTTEQAASHSGGKHGRGGDLLYRWGNPEAYFAGFPFDRQFFAQHDVRWIDQGIPGAGNFLLFNNGDRNSRSYSSVDEFQPPVRPDGSYDLSKTSAFAPQKFSWSYESQRDFSSNRISGAQRLPGGNTLICSGEQGWVFEVTPDGKRVWEFDLSESGLTAQRQGDRGNRAEGRRGGPGSERAGAERPGAERPGAGRPDGFDRPGGFRGGPGGPGGGPGGAPGLFRAPYYPPEHPAISAHLDV